MPRMKPSEKPPVTVSTRFTAYLLEVERQGIRSVAYKHNTSENYVVRMAIRKFLGMSNDPIFGPRP